MDNTFFLPLDTIVLWGKTGETIEVQGNHSESLVTGDRVASETHSERASRRRTALVRKTRSVRTVHWQVARGAASTRGAVRQFLKTFQTRLRCDQTSFPPRSSPKGNGNLCSEND